MRTLWSIKASAQKTVCCAKWGWFKDWVTFWGHEGQCWAGSALGLIWAAWVLTHGPWSSRAWKQCALSEPSAAAELPGKLPSLPPGGGWFQHCLSWLLLHPHWGLDFPCPDICTRGYRDQMKLMPTPPLSLFFWSNTKQGTSFSSFLSQGGK